MYMTGSAVGEGQQHHGTILNLNEAKEQHQFNGEGEPVKKKKKKKPFDPYRPKKQLSKVWGAFRDSPDGAYCKLCGALRKRNDSSTKSLWEHLKQKHPDILKTLKGEEGTSLPQKESNQPINSALQQSVVGGGGSDIGTDIQNMANMLQANAYDPANLNLLGLNAAPAHQFLAGFGLHNGALTQNAVTAAGDAHPFIDIIGQAGMRGNAANVCVQPGRAGSSNRPLLVSQHGVQQPVTLTRWKLEPIAHKDSFTIGFIIKGLRADNNTSYSSEVIKEISPTTFKTASDIVQTHGGMECENKDLCRQQHNIRQFIIQKMMERILK